MVVVTGNENKVSPMDNDLLDITKLRRWRIWKLKLIDARLYFVSIFVGLLTGLVAVPYHYLLQQLFNSRKLFFDGHYPWYFHVLFFFTLWGILLCVNWMVKKMPLITGGGIPQTRAVINGRITYKNPLTQLIAKFTGGILAISAGLSLGREGPCVQIGSYVGNIISKWGHVLAGERKQLLAAGAGAGLAAAFAAPLASSLLVIESIERFDAPKTAITTLLAGVVAGGVASLIFPFNPYSQISAIAPQATFIDQLKLFLFLAVVISVFGKIYSMSRVGVNEITENDTATDKKGDYATNGYDAYVTVSGGKTDGSMKNGTVKVTVAKDDNATESEEVSNVTRLYYESTGVVFVKYKGDSASEHGRK